MAGIKGELRRREMRHKKFVGQVGLQGVHTFPNQLFSCWEVLGGMQWDFPYQVSTPEEAT